MKEFPKKEPEIIPRGISGDFFYRIPGNWFQCLLLHLETPEEDHRKIPDRIPERISGGVPEESSTKKHELECS